MLGNLITAAVALFGVLLGGWMSGRNQHHSWRRDHDAKWTDIRLSTYNDFASAYRDFLAFALDPSAKIIAVPAPAEPDRLMPFFDERGRPYKEKLDAASVAVRLVSESRETMKASGDVITLVRQIAADRATHGESDLSTELFSRLWRAQDEFLDAARRELGLSVVSWAGIRH